VVSLADLVCGRCGGGNLSLSGKSKMDDGTLKQLYACPKCGCLTWAKPKEIKRDTHEV
jgi:ribosomal protein S27AE